MNRTKKIYVTVYLICLMAFTGCASKLGIEAAANNESKISLELDLGKILEEALDSMSAGSLENGVAENQFFFDVPSIKNSLSNACFKNVEISSPVRTKLKLSFTGKFNFIEQAENKTTVKITPEAMEEFSNSLGEEFKNVIELFMAPVLSDEKMSVEEYGELVAAVYGQPLADEMLKSKMEITVGAKNGKSKKYKILLAELLTLAEEKNFASE